MATIAPPVDPESLGESCSGARPRRPIAKLMLFMLAAKIAYDVAIRRWGPTISGADKP